MQERNPSTAGGYGLAPNSDHHLLERAVCVVALVAGAVGSFMVCWAYSGHPLLGRYEFVPIIIIGVLAFVASVIRWTITNGGGSRIGLGELTRPPGTAGVLVLSMLAFGVGNAFFFLARMGTVGGSPQFNRRTGAYELADHGSVTVVSKATYDAAVLNTHQLVLGFAVGFACVAAGLARAIVGQANRAVLLADRQRPLSPEDGVTVEGTATTALDPTGAPPRRALIIADADGLHINNRGVFNSGLRETGNMLLPARSRIYDWSTSWDDVTRIYQTNDRSVVVVCDEQKWVRFAVRTDHMFRRVDPFLVRAGKTTAPHNGVSSS